MRIAYVITRADELGGAQVHVRDLASALHGAGHEVTVLAGSAGVLAEQLAERGVPFRRVPALVRPIAPWADLRAGRQLGALLRELRADLVSAHSSKAGWLARLAARLNGIPAVFTAHGWAFTEGVPALRRRLYALAERLAAPLAEQIITVSDYDRNLALRYRIAPPERIARIHNGVHDSLAAGPPARAAGPVRLLMLGRFAAPKDHATLLRALGGLQDRAWALDLAGSGPIEPTAALARELGIAERVHFLGERRDVEQLLGRSELCVLSSNWEGLPYSILEAMSAGLPVVASDVGGVSEAITHGLNGLLVPRADSEALRAALAGLLDDPERRRQLGAASRRRYEAQFRFEFMQAQTAALYERVATAYRGREAASRARCRS